VSRVELVLLLLLLLLLLPLLLLSTGLSTGQTLSPGLLLLSSVALIVVSVLIRTHGVSLNLFLEYQNIKISKYQNIKISKYQNIKISKYQNIKI
jgi:hypothetical protein